MSSLETSAQLGSRRDRSPFPDCLKLPSHALPRVLPQALTGHWAARHPAAACWADVHSPAPRLLFPGPASPAATAPAPRRSARHRPCRHHRRQAPPSRSSPTPVPPCRPAHLGQDAGHAKHRPAAVHALRLGVPLQLLGVLAQAQGVKAARGAGRAEHASGRAAASLGAATCTQVPPAQRCAAACPVQSTGAAASAWRRPALSFQAARRAVPRRASQPTAVRRPAPRAAPLPGSPVAAGQLAVLQVRREVGAAIGSGSEGVGVRVCGARTPMAPP